MIGRWEIVPDPHERSPGRHRVNVSAEEADLAPLLARFPRKVGKPWAVRKGGFRFAFYFYDPTREDRAALERFFSGDVSPAAPAKPAPKKPAAPPPESFSWEEAPDVEILGDPPASARPEPPKRAAAPAKSSLVQSSLDALADWAESGESAPPREERPPAAPVEERERPTSAPPPPEPAGREAASPDEGMIIKSNEVGMPAEEVQLYKEAKPAVPAGFMYFRVGYFVPEDIGGAAERIHDLVAQTLESRRMPFVFHRVFKFPYRWPDRPLIDMVVESCRKHEIDGLVCVGDERRLELLLEQCAEKGIRYYLLSREDSQKRYWRLGLITRLVVPEE